MFDQRELYALEEGGPLRLDISWGFFSPKIVIRLDGEVISKIPKSQLTELHTFLLNDGSQLEIQQVASFKILGMVFQPYLHITLNGQALPGVIVNPEQRQEDASGWVLFIALMKFVQGILAPTKALTFPLPWKFQELVEWQQSFTGAIATGLILLGLWFLTKRYSKMVLTAALVIILGSFLLELACTLICRQPRTFVLAAIEGLAAISLYQALKTAPKSQ
ncbi:MAG: hypothetical protein KME12_06490 [Trichocoleus desertorum ATA4-8-CV12]|jgi:hypothetical protein|nr:hypothetical protein [Trichocoleus desertorum ATA4-8-CV12]